MPKRTKRQSLERCLKLWSWLAESGSGSKEDAYKACGFTINDSAGCPACEYTSTHGYRYCNENCIIDWGGFCHNSSTPYSRWLHASNKSLRKEYARQIVTLCKEALAKL